jgi:hypothetical protein
MAIAQKEVGTIVDRRFHADELITQAWSTRIGLSGVIFQALSAVDIHCTDHIISTTSR